MVTFTSRAITDTAKMAYKHLPNSKSIIPIKETLYNIDNAKSRAVLVEGIMDVWRIGDGAVCSFGTQLTNEQKALLATTFDTLFILFDADATAKAVRLGNYFEQIMDHVEVIPIDEGDPADHSYEEVRSLKIDLKL